jgi:hypothetical protein
MVRNEKASEKQNSCPDFALKEMDESVILLKGHTSRFQMQHSANL